MLRLIRFIKGFIIIKFSGENAEKILNICNTKKIYLWNMRCKKGYITASITPNDFKRLRIEKRNIKANVRIIKKRGLPFYSAKIVNRKYLIIGMVLFSVFLKVMSLFVWDISVKGNKTVSDEKIISACREIGIKTAKPKSKIDTLNGGTDLLLKIDGLAWAAVNIEGCYLTVDVSESVRSNNGDMPPTDIRAKCDGIVKKINATSGTVEVKVGDIVKKGDVLISGIIENAGSTVFVKAKGNVIAETERQIIESKKFKYKVKKYESTNKKFLIDIFGLKIPFFVENLKDADIEKTEIKQLNITNKKIPIKRYVLYYKPYKTKSKISSEDNIKSQLENYALNKIKEENPISYKLKEKSYKKTQNQIEINATYICEEDISQEVAINIDNN